MPGVVAVAAFVWILFAVLSAFETVGTTFNVLSAVGTGFARWEHWPGLDDGIDIAYTAPALVVPVLLLIAALLLPSGRGGARGALAGFWLVSAISAGFEYGYEPLRPGTSNLVLGIACLALGLIGCILLLPSSARQYFRAKAAVRLARWREHEARLQLAPRPGRPMAAVLACLTGLGSAGLFMGAAAVVLAPVIDAASGIGEFDAEVRTFAAVFVGILAGITAVEAFAAVFLAAGFSFARPLLLLLLWATAAATLWQVPTLEFGFPQSDVINALRFAAAGFGLLTTVLCVIPPANRYFRERAAGRAVRRPAPPPGPGMEVPAWA